jgi:hypothetical protein
MRTQPPPSAGRKCTSLVGPTFATIPRVVITPSIETCSEGDNTSPVSMRYRRAALAVFFWALIAGFSWVVIESAQALQMF